MNQMLTQVIERYPVLQECGPALERALDLFLATYEQGGKLLICGNGGSAADSEHIVGELMKGFLRPRPLPADLRHRLAADAGDEGRMIADHLQGALPAIALTGHLALATAIANDTRADMVFAQQVYGLGKPGDTLLGISTSGNARNVAHAFHVAKACGLHTVALTGRAGGVLATLADVAVCAPADTVVAIQELHLPIYHAWCIALEAHFFP
jgi:D-sedoheptulose 7-phosphate isomerase